MLPCPPKAPSGRMLSRKPAYCWQAGPDTRIFSPLTVAGLCVTTGHYMYLFKRLTAVSAGRFYRFEHIVTYSSSKVVAKSASSSRLTGAIELRKAPVHLKVTLLWPKAEVP